MRTATVTGIRLEKDSIVVTLRKNPWVPYRVWKETMDEMERLIEEDWKYDGDTQANA